MIDTGFEPRASKEHPGFFHVPRYDDLIINRDGQVKHLTEGNLDQHLYGEYLVSNCPGNGSLYIHRLLVTTFIECPGAFEDYVVNHLDGNKLNNAIDNLEWISYSGNLRHAYLTGLRKENMWVRVKDVESGVVTSYHSINETARQLGTNQFNVHYCLNKSKPSLFLGKYLMVLDDMVFPDVFDIPRKGGAKVKPANFVRKPVPIVVTDLTTGIKIPWPSVEKFAMDHGSSKGTVQKSVWKKNGQWRNFNIEYVSV